MRGGELASPSRSRSATTTPANSCRSEVIRGSHASAIASFSNSAWTARGIGSAVRKKMFRAREITVGSGRVVARPHTYADCNLNKDGPMPALQQDECQHGFLHECPACSARINRQATTRRGTGTPKVPVPSWLGTACTVAGVIDGLEHSARKMTMPPPSSSRAKMVPKIVVGARDWRPGGGGSAPLTIVAALDPAALNFSRSMPKKPSSDSERRCFTRRAPGHSEKLFAEALASFRLVRIRGRKDQRVLAPGHASVAPRTSRSQPVVLLDGRSADLHTPGPSCGTWLPHAPTSLPRLRKQQMAG